jgi:hypothetical protein
MTFSNPSTNLAYSDPGYNPAAEAFKNFDQDQSNSLLGSLHLDADDEPRRGASRANSVRFDESALHSHFGHTSRSSTEYLPLRTGSGMGSHPMTERTSSHKSEGKQSSTGQSTHSVRAGSFVLESRPLSATVAPFVPLGPPPGLFILGPVPSIIRCWLDTKFSNESLLYAAVCTGSYRSALDVQLVTRLGIGGQVAVNRRGERVLKIPVYLPEATIQQPSSRNSSPAPRLPTLTVEFLVQTLPSKADAIQVFLGCDVLRAQSADILFSLDRMTLFDDERNKVAVPLVRPENAVAFQNLHTSNLDIDMLKDAASANSLVVAPSPSSVEGQPVEAKLAVGSKIEDQGSEGLKTQPSSLADPTPLSSSPSVIGEARKPAEDAELSDKVLPAQGTPVTLDTATITNGNTLEVATKSDGANIWGSWRRDAVQNGRSESASGTSTISGYQRAGRGRGMKVLKPARLNTSRSSSINQGAGGFEAGSLRTGDSGKGAQTTVTEILQGTATDKSMAGDVRAPLQSLTNKPRSANPVGGASAFPWLNSSEQKPSP